MISARDRFLCLIFALTLGGGVVDIAILFRAEQSAPTVSDPSTSHVVPMNDHGTTHYITPLQNTLTLMLIPIMAVVILVGLGVVWSDDIELFLRQRKKS
jgi:hypothetical protein